MVFIVPWLGKKKKFLKQINKSASVAKMSFEIIETYEIQKSIS